MKFWCLWGFDALVMLVGVILFVIGLWDRSVSSSNFLLWICLLAVLGGMLLGGIVLRSMGHPMAAMGLLLLMAIPAFTAGFFLLLLILLKPIWN